MVLPWVLHREWRLHHSPTVVAGSSKDCNCTRTKGTASDVQRRGANRATKEGKASGRSDRHCHLSWASQRGQGRLRNSGRASRRSRGKQVPVNRNSGRRQWQYVDGGPPCQRRTRWLARPASVTTCCKKIPRRPNNPIRLIDRPLRAAKTQEETPSLRARVARRKRQKVKGRNSRAEMSPRVCDGPDVPKHACQTRHLSHRSSR